MARRREAVRLGGIEAGGTKMVCAVVDENGNVLDRVTFPTTTSEETIAKMVDYFRLQNIEALGIASFGPIDLCENSDTYGCILRTPKEGWENVNFIQPFQKLGVPIGIDTDVNGAVYGEVLYGAAKGCESAIYITIGTGIGVGVFVNGELLHGRLHPEAGHILLKASEMDISNGGYCHFHKNCFEGLASGPAIEKRWGKPAIELYDKDEVWDLESDYIAQAIMNYILCYSPEKIILWGGVMHNEKLFDMVRSKTREYINGYVAFADSDIVAPLLGENTGVIGAAMLGKKML